MQPSVDNDPVPLVGRHEGHLCRDHVSACRKETKETERERERERERCEVKEHKHVELE